MSRRRLEDAIQAGKAIEKGDTTCTEYTKLLSTIACDYEEGKDGVYSLQYSHDSDLIAVGYGDGSIEVLSSRTGMLHRAIKGRRHPFLPVTCMRFNPVSQDSFLAATAEGKIFMCRVNRGEPYELVITEPENEINCLDFSLDGDKFATAGKDMTIRIYDSTNNKCLHEYTGYSYINPESLQDGHAQRVFALKYHPHHSHVLVTGGWDNHLKVWDTRTLEGVVRTINGPHICGDSIDIKGNQILTGSWTPTDSLQLWDYGEGELLQTLPFPSAAEGEFLYCAQFAANDVVLAGGSGTNNVQAIHIASQEVLGEIQLSHPVQAMDSTKGGQLVTAAGMGYRLKMGGLS